MEKYHMHNRTDREIKDEAQIRTLIKRGKYVTLSLCNNNQPYIVTLSYGYDHPTHSLYMHCAKEGLKLDFIRSNPSACGTVIEDGGYIQNECAHRYKTVVFFGKISILTDLEEKRKGMEVLLNHLENEKDMIHAKVNSNIKLYQKLVILKFEIHEIHGKAGR